MNSYLVFCINVIYENSEVVEFVENLYWIESINSLGAFDMATRIAKAKAKVEKEAFKEKRSFIGITEVLPILKFPSHGISIGHRLYSLDNEKEIMDSIMSRKDFINLETKRSNM
jgi:hypothetical protein